MDLSLVSVSFGVIFDSFHFLTSLGYNRSYHWWLCLPIPWLALAQLACFDMQRHLTLSNVSCERDLFTCSSSTKNQKEAEVDWRPSMVVPLRPRGDRVASVEDQFDSTSTYGSA